MPNDSLSSFERRLIEGFQRRLPMESRPYAAMARTLGVTEAKILTSLNDLVAKGMVSRVGPVFRPRSIGYSTLAALSVPPEELDSVAALVNGYQEVNHNYERTHLFNLWFVVTGPDRGAVSAVLRDIRQRTGRLPLDLPLETAYHIDLGFALNGGTDVPRRVRPTRPGDSATTIHLSPRQEAMVAALQDGIALTPRPFAKIAALCGSDEESVLEQLREWLGAGIVKRFGIVVRHRELGYRANGMVVWDIPDAGVDAVGERFATYGAVNLCYRRPRRAQRWPYNLFCMIHGQQRAGVRAHVKQLAAATELRNPRYAILFSVRRFKQRGAVYCRTESHRAPIARSQAQIQTVPGLIGHG